MPAWFSWRRAWPTSWRSCSGTPTKRTTDRADERAPSNEEPTSRSLMPAKAPQKMTYSTTTWRADPWKPVCNNECRIKLETATVMMVGCRHPLSAKRGLDCNDCSDALPDVRRPDLPTSPIIDTQVLDPHQRRRRRAFRDGWTNVPTPWLWLDAHGRRRPGGTGSRGDQRLLHRPAGLHVSLRRGAAVHQWPHVEQRRNRATAHQPPLLREAASRIHNGAAQDGRTCDAGGYQRRAVDVPLHVRRLPGGATSRTRASFRRLELLRLAPPLPVPEGPLLPVRACRPPRPASRPGPLLCEAASECASGAQLSRPCSREAAP